MEIKTRKNLFPRDFIENSLIENLESLLPNDSRSGYSYELFILISIGIEFLGACEDLEPWDSERRGLSRERFLTGIMLFPQKYHQFKGFLYKKLRCGMAHIYAPIPGLGLGENKHNTLNLTGYKNENDEYQLSLNIQDFFADFKTACEEVVKKIEDKKYSLDSKVYKSFLSVPIN